MKNLLSVAVLSMCFMASAQWTSKTINSDFDGTFKKAYTKVSNEGMLMMEEDKKGGFPFLYLAGSFFCDDETTIDIVFHSASGKKMYTEPVFKSEDGTIYFFFDEVWSDEFRTDFTNATKVLLRVNQSYCGDEFYEFSMSGSTNAFNFLNK